MTAITSFVLAVGAWVKGVSLQKPRAPIIAGLLWLWMWVLLWGSTENPDLDTYLYLYDSDQTTSGIGPGYWLLVRAAQAVDLGYTAFLAVTSGLAFLILATVASWFTDRTSIVAALYFVYPFVYDAIQARNLIAMSLVVLGFALRSRMPRHGAIWFVALILTAATLHFAMLVFLLVVPVTGKHGHLLAQGAMVLGLLSTAVAAIVPDAMARLAQVIVRSLDASSYEAYVSTQGSLGVLLYASLHILSLLLIRRTVAVIAADSEIPSSGKLDHAAHLTFATYTFRAAMVMTVILPFVALNSNFFRILRNLWILYSISFCVGLDSQARSRNARTLVLAVAGLAVLHCLFFVVWGFDRVAAPLLQHNRVADYVRELI